MSNFWVNMGMAGPWKDKLDQLKEEEAQRMKIIIDARMKREAERMRQEAMRAREDEHLKKMEEQGLLLQDDSLDQLVKKRPLFPSPVPPPYIAGKFGPMYKK